MKTCMRWGAFAVGVGLMLVPGQGRAEEPAVKQRMVVLAQPLYGYVGSVAGSVEYAVGPYVALEGAVQATLYLDDHYQANGLGAEFSTHRWGVGVDPGVHFYLAGRAPEGLWVGPHVEFSVLRHQTETDVSTPDGGFVPVSLGSRTLEYGGSMRVGYTAILSPGLTVQTGLGLAVLHGRSTAFGPSYPSGVMGLSGPLAEQRTWSLSPRMTLGVGWAL
jgi:hypothetical protein